jgi:hypothetical protein
LFQQNPTVGVQAFPSGLGRSEPSRIGVPGLFCTRSHERDCTQRSGPSLRCAEVRADGGSRGHACWQLRPAVAHQGRRGDAADSEAAQPAVRDGDHRAVSPARDLGGRGVDEMYLPGDSVFSPLIAAKTTFALKPAEWFLRGRLLIGSPRHSQLKAVHQQNRHLYPCSVFLSHLYPLLLIRPQ